MPHTPGPWTWTEGWGADDILTGILGPDRQLVIEPLEGDGDPAFRCKPEDIRVITQAPEMYALLKELEWSDRVCITLEPSGMQYWANGCPVCGSRTEHDHTLDCKLATVLKAVEGES